MIVRWNIGFGTFLMFMGGVWILGALMMLLFDNAVGSNQVSAVVVDYQTETQTDSTGQSVVVYRPLCSVSDNGKTTIVELPSATTERTYAIGDVLDIDYAVAFPEKKPSNILSFLLLPLGVVLIGVGFYLNRRAKKRKRPADPWE